MGSVDASKSRVAIFFQFVPKVFVDFTVPVKVVKVEMACRQADRGSCEEGDVRLDEAANITMKRSSFLQTTETKLQALPASAFSDWSHRTGHYLAGWPSDVNGGKSNSYNRVIRFLTFRSAEGLSGEHPSSFSLMIADSE